jgi:hypothetical protein
MEFIREIVDSEKLYGIFDIPASLRECKVEVTVLPLHREIKEQPFCDDSAFGGLQKYANPALIPLEEGAWERAVVEKYDNKNN